MSRQTASPFIQAEVSQVTEWLLNTSRLVLSKGHRICSTKLALEAINSLFAATPFTHTTMIDRDLTYGPLTATKHIFKHTANKIVIELLVFDHAVSGKTLLSSCTITMQGKSKTYAIWNKSDTAQLIVRQADDNLYKGRMRRLYRRIKSLAEQNSHSVLATFYSDIAGRLRRYIEYVKKMAQESPTEFQVSFNKLADNGQDARLISILESVKESLGRDEVKYLSIRIPAVDTGWIKMPVLDLIITRTSFDLRKKDPAGEASAYMQPFSSSPEKSANQTAIVALLGIGHVFGNENINPSDKSVLTTLSQNILAKTPVVDVLIHELAHVLRGTRVPDRENKSIMDLKIARDNTKDQNKKHILYVNAPHEKNPFSMQLVDRVWRWMEAERVKFPLTVDEMDALFVFRDEDELRKLTKEDQKAYGKMKGIIDIVGHFTAQNRKRVLTYIYKVMNERAKQGDAA